MKSPIRLLAAGLAVTALAACGSTGTPATTSPTPTETDTLTVVTDTAVNADLDLQVVLVHRRLQLSRVVEGSHHDVSTLPPLRVEAVVMNDPSPDRVIHRIHLGHPAHPHASATVNRSNTQAHSGPGSPTSQRSPGQRGTTTRPRGAAAEGPRRSPP